MDHVVHKRKIHSLPFGFKNKPHHGEMEHEFILGSMECTVTNSYCIYLLRMLKCQEAVDTRGVSALLQFQDAVNSHNKYRACHGVPSLGTLLNLYSKLFSYYNSTVARCLSEESVSPQLYAR
jgi:hypothetical protein